MPTCIDARVRKLGLKKTSATERPASGFEESSPRLKRAADASKPSSSSRVQSPVERKFLGIVLSEAPTRTNRGKVSDARHSPDSPAPNALERLHDLRMVRPPQRVKQPKLVRRGAPQLGPRALRVHASSPCEPDGLHAPHAAAVENLAGGHHARGLRALRALLHAPALEARLPLGRLLHARRGLLRLPLLSAKLLQSIDEHP